MSTKFTKLIESGEMTADEVINFINTDTKNREYINKNKYASIETVQKDTRVLFILTEPTIRDDITVGFSKIVIKSIEIPATFGERLRQRREELGIIQEEITQRIGINKSTYADYEANRRTPNAYILSEISDILNCTLDYLVKGIY